MNQLSMRQKTKNALERIDGLEKTVSYLVDATNKGLGEFDEKLQAVAELTNAMVTLLGQDAVSNAIAEARANADADAVKRQQDQVDELKTKGILVAAETVGEDTLIVGKETDKDGNVLRPGRAQIQMGQLKPEIKAILAGKAIGTVIDTPGGGKFEVQELYTVVPKAAETEAPVAKEAVAEAELVVAEATGTTNTEATV